MKEIEVSYCTCICTQHPKVHEKITNILIKNDDGSYSIKEKNDDN